MHQYGDNPTTEPIEEFPPDVVDATGADYDEFIEREGGYYLNFNPRDGIEQVYYVAHCAFCYDLLNDTGDGYYVHGSAQQGRECWEARQSKP